MRGAFDGVRPSRYCSRVVETRKVLRNAASPPPVDAANAAEAGAPPEAGSGLAFEAALDELEALVDRLEDGDLALEQALASFERGVALSRRCAELLDRAERRIEVLVRDGAGSGVQPFDETDAAPPAPEEG